MKILLLLLFQNLFVIGLHFSCNPHPNRNIITHNDSKKQDSIIKDIPFRKNASRHAKIRELLEKKLGLESLKNGIDGTEIRIKYEYAFSDTFKLVRLMLKDANWNGGIYTVRFQLNEKYDTLILFNSEYLAKAPVSGWKPFTDSLIDLSILTLPDYTQLPGFELPMDSDGVSVEIAKNNLYRFYAYPETEYNANKYWQAKSMNQILKLIENNFQVKF